jgi:hypothetical protein
MLNRIARKNCPGNMFYLFRSLSASPKIDPVAPDVQALWLILVIQVGLI